MRLSSRPVTGGDATTSERKRIDGQAETKEDDAKAHGNPHDFLLIQTRCGRHPPGSIDRTSPGIRTLTICWPVPCTQIRHNNPFVDSSRTVRTKTGEMGEVCSRSNVITASATKGGENRGQG